MTADAALGWVTIYGLIVAVSLGAVAFCGPLYKYFRGSIHWTGLIVLIVGSIMIFSPKWTEISVKFKGFEGKIAELNKQIENGNTRIAELEEENQVLVNQRSENLDGYKNYANNPFMPAGGSASMAKIPPSDFFTYKPVSDDKFKEVLRNVCNSAVRNIDNAVDNAAYSVDNCASWADTSIKGTGLIRNILNESGVYFFEKAPVSKVPLKDAIMKDSILPLVKDTPATAIDLLSKP